ncbi:MAG: PAS domain S-box protein [Candidatus Marinimicrobia bacterium]|nr:PAS domain S-box protein [Candidatus Neomarinimicrobiota bacterium]
MKKSADIDIMRSKLLPNKSNSVKDPKSSDQIYLSKLRDIIGEAIFTVDLPSRKIKYVNNAIETIFGYKDYECIGKTTELFYPTKTEFNKVGKLLKAAIRDGKNILTLELRLRKKNGDTFPAEITTTFMKEEGKFSQIISIVKDLSNRVITEETLEHKQEYLELLHNNIDEAIVTVELPGRIIKHVNKAVKKIFGYTPEECIGRNTEHFFPNRDDYLKAGERIEKRIKSGKKFTRIERLLKRKNGEIFLAEISTSIMKLKDGTRQIVSIARDLSKETDTKLALLESQEQLEQIFSKTHVLIAYIDTKFNFIRVNKAYADADGEKPDYYSLKNYFDLYPNSENKKIFRDAVRTGTPYQTFSKPLIPKENPEKDTSYWDWNLYPVKDSDDNVESLILSLIDVSDRVNAEKAVLESEKKYKTFFEDSKDAIYLTSVDGTIEDANNAFLKLFGYDKNEIIANNVKSLYSNPTDREKFLQIIESEGSVLDYELTLKKRDGTEIQCLVTSSAKRDDDNNIIGYQGIIRDMSESIKADAELKKLSNAVEQAAEMILIADNNGIIQYVNPEFELITGYKKDEVIGKTPRILKSNKHPEEFYRNMWDMMLGGDTFRGLIINKKKNGEIYYEEKIISPLKDDEGKITHFVSNGRDITKRINAEKKIKEQRKFLRQVLDINPNIIFAKDKEGRYTLANQATANLFNTTIKDLIGKKYSELNPNSSETEEDLKNDQLMFETLEESINPENHVTDINGIKHIYHTIKRPVIDEHGKATHILGISMDITEQKKAEEEKINLERKLERARRMESLGILAGGVAHDLNNILGPILGYPDLILATLPPDNPIRSDLEMIKTAAEKASDVVQDLLTLARRGRYDMKPLNVNEMIKEYFLSPTFKSNKARYPDVSYKLELDENVKFIKGSNPHLSKTIMNLVINAFESMTHGGNMTLRTFSESLETRTLIFGNLPKGNYTIIDVKDTGFGIEEEDLPHIFEPFYTRKEMGRSGSGLGLSVVFGVIQDHNGYLDVSTEIGVGSTFSIYLPSIENHQISNNNIEKNLNGSESILVVDDIEEQRNLAARLLSSLGYKTDTAENGTQAIKMLKNKQYDLIVLDMIMEDNFDGLDTFKEIIKIRPDQKTIIVSGFAETERVKEARNLGVGSYIRKPYSIKKIGTAIRAMLEKK